MPRNIRNTRRNFARPSDTITPASSAGSFVDTQGRVSSTIAVTKISNPVGPSGIGSYVVTSVPSGLSGTATTTATTATVTFSAPATTSSTTYDIYVADSNYNGAGKPVKVSTPITVPPGFNISALVIAGGGSGNGFQSGTNGASGGGGAGGYREFSSYGVLTSTNYPVTIGAGGTATLTYDGTSGSDSTFSAAVATGGGKSGFWWPGQGVFAGEQGGSGGGAAIQGSNTAGFGVSVAITQFPNVELYSTQGRNGGTSFYYSAAAYTGAGGGGGAVGLGGNAGSSGSGGNGGVGRASSITGSSVTRAGGGGGGSNQNTAGTGGTGGGGAGGTNNVGTNGTANTGGGGGGAGSAGSAYSGGNGGSGVVILRYPNTYTITIGAGLTGSTATTGSDKVTTITAGTGNVSWA